MTKLMVTFELIPLVRNKMLDSNNKKFDLSKKFRILFTITCNETDVNIGRITRI